MGEDDPMYAPAECRKNFFDLAVDQTISPVRENHQPAIITTRGNGSFLQRRRRSPQIDWSETW
jgi:hypothetical protein